VPSRRGSWDEAPQPGRGGDEFAETVTDGEVALRQLQQQAPAVTAAVGAGVHTSKVAQMRSLWEKGFGAEKGSTGPAPWPGAKEKEKVAVAASTAPGTAAAGGGRRAERSSAASWVRCASDMTRRRRQEEIHTCRLTERLTRRLTEITGDAGSPLSSSCRTGSEPSSPEPCEEQDSPMTRVHRSMVRELSSHIRTQNKITRAVLRFFSLDGRGGGSTGGGHEEDEDMVGPVSQEIAVHLPLAWAEMPGLEQPSRSSASRRTSAAEASRRTSATQPEEEADGSLAEVGVAVEDAVAEASALDVGKMMQAVPDDTSRRYSQPEPAREPQPKESPRGEADATALALPTACRADTEAHEEPDDEPPEAGIPPSKVAADEATPEAVESSESSVDTSSSVTDASSSVTGSAESEEAPPEAPVESEEESFSSAPKPGELGMPRENTMLYSIEQSELHRTVMVVVPEGMKESRMVSFLFENKKHDVEIPEGYAVGQEVPIFIPRRPPLERNQAQAWCRGHYNFPDRQYLTEQLKHSSRLGKDCSFDDPEFQHRRNVYGLLRGREMSLMLANWAEEDAEALAEAAA